MYLGGIASPFPEKHFDGRVFLKRVAKETLYKKTSYNQNISHRGEINDFLKKKEGGWREVLANCFSTEDEVKLVEMKQSAD